MHGATYWHLTRYQRLSSLPLTAMCNLYSITTNQAAIAALFRVINQYVGNLPTDARSVPPDYPAPVVRNDYGYRELVRPEDFDSSEMFATSRLT